MSEDFEQFWNTALEYGKLNRKCGNTLTLEELQFVATAILWDVGFSMQQIARVLKISQKRAREFVQIYEIDKAKKRVV